VSDPVVPGHLPKPGPEYLAMQVAQSAWPRIRLWVRPEYAGRDPGQLVHLALLAAARRRLGAERWRIPNEVGERVPDALWERGNGVWAVEVDRSYPREKVERKVRAYLRYAGQVWVVPSRKRAVLVRELAFPHPVETLVLRVADLVSGVMG